MSDGVLGFRNRSLSEGLAQDVAMIVTEEIESNPSQDIPPFRRSHTGYPWHARIFTTIAPPLASIPFDCVPFVVIFYTCNRQPAVAFLKVVSSHLLLSKKSYRVTLSFVGFSLDTLQPRKGSVFRTFNLQFPHVWTILRKVHDWVYSVTEAIPIGGFFSKDEYGFPKIWEIHEIC